MNNPMSGSDPSGFGWLANISVGDAVGAAVIAGHAVSYGILVGNSDSLAGASPTSAGSITTGSIAGGGLGIGQAAYGLATSGNGGSAAPTGRLGTGAREATGDGLSQGGSEGARYGHANGANPANYGGFADFRPLEGFSEFQPVPQRIRDALTPFLGQYLSEAGLSWDDVWLASGRLADTYPGKQWANVAAVDTYRVMTKTEQLALYAHEIVHVVQEAILGTDVLEARIAAEYGRFGDEVYSLRRWHLTYANAPLRPASAVSSNYSLEAISQRVQADVYNAFGGL